MVCRLRPQPVPIVKFVLLCNEHEHKHKIVPAPRRAAFTGGSTGRQWAKCKDSTDPPFLPYILRFSEYAKIICLMQNISEKQTIECLDHGTPKIGPASFVWAVSREPVTGFQ